MKFIPKSASKASEIEHVITKHLTLGEATPSDVEQFLQEEQLPYQYYVDKSKHFNGAAAYIANKPFNSLIVSHTPAPSEKWTWRWFYEWIWCIEFHFLDSKLNEIIITRGGTGP